MELKMIRRDRIRMQAYEIRMNAYNEAVKIKDAMKKTIDVYNIGDSVPCELVRSYLNQLEKVAYSEIKLKKLEEKSRK